MSKVFCDYTKLIERQQKASLDARERLKAKGLFFPIYASNLSPEDYYAKLMAYSEAEANLIVEILRESDIPKPPISETIKPAQRGWDGYAD